MYKFLMGPVDILGLRFRTVRLFWGKYNGRPVRIINFQFFPHKRSLRDFPESPGLFEELLPFLLVIRALKGRAVVLESTGVAGPAVGAMFWEVELAISRVEFSADALPAVSITIAPVGLWDRRSARH
jgi:hypothetical protein